MKQKHVHINAKAIQRSKGKSSVAAAAYRSGEELKDERKNETHDYTRKKGVDENWIVGYEGSREELWNLAEASEKRKDATTAKEYDMALPKELSADDRIVLAQKYANYLHREHGCAVDVCIHNLHGDNPHAHMMMTTRAIEPDGSMSKEKLRREWSDKKRKEHGLPGRKTLLENDRAMWTGANNYMLRKKEISGVKYEHKSYKRLGSDKKPTKHHGPRDDFRSRLIKQYNDAVREFNKTIDEIEGIKNDIKTRDKYLEQAKDFQIPQQAKEPDLMREPVPVSKSKPAEKKKKDPEKNKPFISPKIAEALNNIKERFDRAGEYSDSQNMFPPEYLQRDSDWYQNKGNEIYDDLFGQKKEREMNQPKPQQPTNKGPEMKGPGM